jgi:hypothetical protein
MPDDDFGTVSRLVNLYAFAVDTQKWDLFDEVFTKDVVADFDSLVRWTDLASWKRDFEVHHRTLDATQHTMSNIVWERQGDLIRAVTYGHWRLIRWGFEGGDMWEGCGWYDDEFVELDDGWRIKTRICKIIWWGGNPRVTWGDSPAALASDFARGEATSSLRQAANDGTVAFLANRVAT